MDNTQTGILVTTSLTAGLDGSNLNHGEGIVVSTAITAEAAKEGVTLNHSEGIVVSTAITAGIDGGLLPGERQQHAEGLVRR